MTALLTDDATREAVRLHVSDYCDVDQGAVWTEIFTDGFESGGVTKWTQGQG